MRKIKERSDSIVLLVTSWIAIVIVLLWIFLLFKIYLFMDNPLNCTGITNAIGVILGLIIFASKYVPSLKIEHISKVFEKNNSGLIIKEGIYLYAILSILSFVWRYFYLPNSDTYSHSDWLPSLWHTSSVATDLYQINAILSSVTTIIVSGIAITSPILQTTWSQLLDSVHSLKNDPTINMYKNKNELLRLADKLFKESNNVGKYLFRPFIMLSFRLALISLLLETYHFISSLQIGFDNGINVTYHFVFFLFGVALVSSCSFLVGILFLLSARIARRKSEIQSGTAKEEE